MIWLNELLLNSNIKVKNIFQLNTNSVKLHASFGLVARNEHLAENFELIWKSKKKLWRPKKANLTHFCPVDLINSDPSHGFEREKGVCCKKEDSHLS